MTIEMEEVLGVCGIANWMRPGSARNMPVKLRPKSQAAAEVRQGSEPTRVLLVVAHPDDEYYFAATVYRLTHELGAIVDHVVLTNGEGGFRHSALAERIYGKSLTLEHIGRSILPSIRRRETIAAGRILGIRSQDFLGERDLRYTLDIDEALNDSWKREKILRRLKRKLFREQYDFVFTLLPTSDTHGHHQAATLLTLEAVASLAPEARPVVLGAEPSLKAESPRRNWPASPFPLLAIDESAPVFEFDRTRPFDCHSGLHYQIVVNWVIAEHKSQGLLQTLAGKHDCERFWIFEASPRDALARTSELFRNLEGQICASSRATATT